MRRLIITLALISCTISAKAQAPDAVDHVENEARFANPERGFYLYENLLNLSREIGRRRAEGHTLIWGKIPLDAYREQTPLPQAHARLAYQRFCHGAQQRHEGHSARFVWLARRRRRLHEL